MALVGNDEAKDAEAVLLECVSIREKALVNTKNDWLIANTQSNLGGCLTKLSKFGEAETLLTESAESLQKNGNAPEDRKTEAIQRVIDLYEAWNTAEPGKGHDAKAAEWRAKLPQTTDEEAQDLSEEPESDTRQFRFL